MRATGRSLFASLAAHSSFLSTTTRSSSSSSSIISGYCPAPPLVASAMTMMMSSSSSSSVPASASSPSSSPASPLLRGVVFDMDGTLTKPNLDFAEMYRRCGVDLAHDILEQIAQMPQEEQLRAMEIIETMEDEARQTLELMPGAKELISWLKAHEIPMAIVTRNTQKTTDVLLTQTMMLAPTHPFSLVIARDAGYPPKPDPTAMAVIAEQWDVELPTESLLMVGDSLSNDVVFGKRAGVRTALLDSGRRYQELLAGKVPGAVVNADNADDDDDDDDDDDPLLLPDFVMGTLWSLPRQLWKEYHIGGPLGSSQPSLPKVPAPQPTTPLAVAAANGDIDAIKNVLVHDASEEETIIIINEPDESGNTALIWAVERNQEKAVQVLLSYPHIDVNHRGFLGATAVSRAARRGYNSILQQLLLTLQTPDTDTDTNKKPDLDLPNDKLQHPLHFAAFQRHISTVELLLQHGANPLVLDRKGRTPAQDTADEAIRAILLASEAQHTII